MIRKALIILALAVLLLLLLKVFLAALGLFLGALIVLYFLSAADVHDDVHRPDDGYDC